MQKIAKSGIPKKKVEKLNDLEMAAEGGLALGMLGGNALSYLIRKKLGDKLYKGHKTLHGISKQDLENLSSVMNNKYVKDLDPKLINKFIQEHKLTQKGVRLNLGESKGLSFLGRSGKLSDYYNPIKKTVNLRTASPAVALHELGHASDFGKYSILKSSLYRTPHMASMILTPIALAYGDVLKRKIPGKVDDKVVDFVQKHPALTSVGGYGAGVLVPEAMATTKALRFVSKEKGFQAAKEMFKKSLGPAYGTYLAGALPIALGAIFASKLVDFFKGKKKAPKRQMMKAASAMPKGKVFARGFAAGALPVTVALALMGSSPLAQDYFKYRDEILKHRFKSSFIPQEKANYYMQRKSNKFMKEHPYITSGVYGSLVGLLTGSLMSGLPVLKKAITKGK